jgi:hypothetical protein
MKGSFITLSVTKDPFIAVVNEAGRNMPGLRRPGRQPHDRAVTCHLRLHTRKL